ncbi:tetratricopeptide repeat protein [Desulfovibrio mangrovi]|uniref:tetratricopeptide repeat protein n=1 Tax=Desulfovibrio mangrovi TaxID=2976983 RepID=UPI002246E215|nr:tetratricopeptide repeat protein [Desulfovibrio mangrovi]UZP67827.1 tetratricopeptide repeat protein [Desulfovibrio mangrovi]
MASSAFEGMEYPIKGVFSTDREMKIGFGATKRTVTQSVLVFVEQDAEGCLWGQGINANDVPSGDRYVITPDQLLNSYLPDPAIYHLRVLPAIRGLNKTISRAERHRMHGELYSAEYEFNNALRIDEVNVRATFGLGLVYLDRQDAEKAQFVFERLIHLDAAFESLHKHMFNEFGIKLRKNALYAEALRFYGRALQLAGEDDHLMYNIARSFLESGDNDGARKYMSKALELNPDLREARMLKKYLEQGGELAPPESL